MAVLLMKMMHLVLK